MPAIPFLPSETNYVLSCPVDDYQILFDTRWNSRDEAWYVDIYEADGTIIELNVKIVVGITLANRSDHPFFENHTMLAIDTTAQGLDPTFDDLGTRVVVLLQTPEDLT